MVAVLIIELHFSDDCPMLNIPGDIFSVKEYMLEEIIEITRWALKFNGEQQNVIKQ